MTNKQTLVYIIPTYNERENIIKMLNVVIKILKRLNKYRTIILVVDDNSPDGTSQLVKRFLTNNPSVILLKGQRKGLGKAMIRGYQYAENVLHADIVISNEADFTYNPITTIKMVKYIENGCDVVFASRKLSTNNKWSWTRRIIHWFANDFFASWLSDVKQIRDHNSAFRAIRINGVLDKLKLNEFPSGFAFFNYLTFKILTVTDNYKEIYVQYKPRHRGESKISLKPRYMNVFLRDVYEYIITCLRIKFHKQPQC